MLNLTFGVISAAFLLNNASKIINNSSLQLHFFVPFPGTFFGKSSRSWRQNASTVKTEMKYKRGKTEFFL